MQAPARTFPLDDRVEALAFSPDGARLAVGSGKGVVLLGLDGVAEWTATGSANGLAWSPDGAGLAVAGWPCRVYEVDSGEALWDVDCDGLGVAWSPDGALVAFGSHGMASDVIPNVYAFDASNGAEAWRSRRRRGDQGIAGLAFSGDGYLAVTDERQVTFLAASQGSAEYGCSAPAFLLNAIAYATGRTDRLAVAVGQRVGVWTMPDSGWEEVELPNPHNVMTVAWAPDGVHLVAGVNDGTCRVWHTTRKEVVAELPGTRAAWSPDGRWIATADGKKLHLFDATAWSGAAVPAIEPEPLSCKTRTEEEVRAADEAAQAELRSTLASLVQQFGACMIAEGEEHLAKARAFNRALDAYFAVAGGASVASVAMAIADAMGPGMYPTVFGDLVRVRGIGS